MAAVIGSIIPSGQDGTGAGNHQIVLVSGPIHYDILLPIDQISQAAFADLVDHDILLNHPAAEWLVLGWGAHDFYTQTGGYSDLSMRAVWRGITGDRSVMRVDLAGLLPPELISQSIFLSGEQYGAMIKALRNSFASGPLQPLQTPGFTDTDVFFAAQGRFHIGRTCNVWIGEMMRAAGLRFGIWTPLPVSVRLSHGLYQTRSR